MFKNLRVHIYTKIVNENSSKVSDQIIRIFLSPFVVKGSGDTNLSKKLGLITNVRDIIWSYQGVTSSILTKFSAKCRSAIENKLENLNFLHTN